MGFQIPHIALNEITLRQLVFAAVAGMTLGSAALVVLMRNVFHSLLFLTLSFLGVAGLYLLLSADFMAAVQVLVYVGAIIVLMMFALMLTHRVMSTKLRQTVAQWWLALPVSGGIFLLLGRVFVLYPWKWHMRPQGATTGIIGQGLLIKYLLPFELASIVLLVAMVGAIILAKEDKPDDPA
jgi:NADH-quinone oxidoreductase subunit J